MYFLVQGCDIPKNIIILSMIKIVNYDKQVNKD
jgi:hypothetical protein